MKGDTVRKGKYKCPDISLRHMKGDTVREGKYKCTDISLRHLTQYHERMYKRYKRITCAYTNSVLSAQIHAYTKKQACYQERL